MNILCCLVHPVGTYLGYSVCFYHLPILGLKEEWVYNLMGPKHGVVVQQGSPEITENIANWVKAHSALNT